MVKQKSAFCDSKRFHFCCSKLVLGRHFVDLILKLSFAGSKILIYNPRLKTFADMRCNFLSTNDIILKV